MTISFSVARGAPMLELEQERFLIKDWQETGNQKSLEHLIMSHARLVFAMARRYSSDKNDQEELVSEGFLGLVKAAEVFDLERETRFSTYARWWIKNSIFTAFTRMNTVVDVPSRKPAAVFLNHSRALNDGGEEGDNETFVERFYSLDPTPEEQVIARSTRDFMRNRISDAIKDLNDMEREVVLARNLRHQPDTIEDIAKRLGVSRERLRQIERRAMSKLKYMLMSHGVSSMHLG